MVEVFLASHIERHFMEKFPMDVLFFGNEFQSSPKIKNEANIKPLIKCNLF